MVSYLGTSLPQSNGSGVKLSSKLLTMVSITMADLAIIDGSWPNSVDDLFGAFVMDFKKDQVLDVFRSLHIIYYVVLRR